MALTAAAVALVAWPTGYPAGRLRELANASRLAGAADSTRRWHRRLAVPTHGWSLASAFLAGALAALWRGPAVGTAAAAATGVCLSGVTRAARRRAAEVRDRDLSAALRLLRAELDAGSPGPAALRTAASVAGAYRFAFEACARASADSDDVVASVSGMDGGRELMVIAQVWQLAATLGVPVADSLARVDDDVQARRSQRRAVAAALAGPRSSASLLAGLPVLGVVLGMAMGARPLSVLFNTAGGRLLLCVGVLLDVAGVAWTAHLIRSAERA